MFCKVCGKELSEDALFCTGCGNPVNQTSTNTTSTASASEYAAKQVDKFTQTVNEIAGGHGAVKLRFKDLFSEVFKKHDSDQADEIFICGTKTTTPEVKHISTEWPKPWLFARVALLMFATFMVMNLCWSLFGNTKSLPGINTLGSFMIPFSILVMFFEMNAPRNISFFETIGIFFLGGCLSLLSALVIGSLFRSSELPYIEAVITGIVEEAGKALIVAIFISRSRKCKYVLNGLLVGAAVGAGFAAFESSGYAFTILLNKGVAAMFNLILIRGFLTPGGHVAWAAIEGAAIMLALDKKPFEWNVLLDKRFLLLTSFCVIMHAVWDMPIKILPYYIKYIGLVVVAWMIVLVMINRGLEEINEMTIKKE